LELGFRFPVDVILQVVCKDTSFLILVDALFLVDYFAKVS
jgi:hypothetical protein